MKIILPILFCFVFSTQAQAALSFSCKSENSGPEISLDLRDNFFSYEDNVLLIQWNPQDLAGVPTDFLQKVFEDSEKNLSWYEDPQANWARIEILVQSRLKFIFNMPLNNKASSSWGVLESDGKSVKVLCEKI